jgi:hypothetical protein
VPFINGHLVCRTILVEQKGSVHIEVFRIGARVANFQMVVRSSSGDPITGRRKMRMTFAPKVTASSSTAVTSVSAPQGQVIIVDARDKE